VEDGWLRSGDAGFLDTQGISQIIDRAKTSRAWPTAANFSAQVLENKLKSHPTSRSRLHRPGPALRGRDSGHRSHGRGNLGRSAGGAYTSYTDLSQKPSLRLVGGCGWKSSE